MDAFEPVINLLIILTILSFAAEKVTQLIKMKWINPEANRLIAKGDDKKETETERVFMVSKMSTYIGIAMALVVKADFFEMIANLEDPWSTFGWVRVQTGEWMRSYASQSFGTALYAALGCLVTGVALSFGSKFWHDVLKIVFELKNRKKKLEGDAAGA